jgi:hypothetical protein
MPSYRSLLVLSLAAYTVAPVLAAEADIRPLYGILYLIILVRVRTSDLFDSSSKKNEGRALSHLELVERDKQPLEVPAPRTSVPLALSAPKSLSGKMKALIGAAIVVNGVFDWALLAYYHNKYGNSNSDPPNSVPPSPSPATPPSNVPAPQQNYVSPQPEVTHLTHVTQQTTDSLTDPTQQTYGNTSTGSTQQISTNNDTNSRREEHPRGRHSPVDIPSELYPESESRIDAAADGNVTYAGI